MNGQSGTYQSLYPTIQLEPLAGPPHLNPRIGQFRLGADCVGDRGDRGEL